MIITLTLMNKQGVRFEKDFTSYQECRTFIIRCLHGNNIKLVGYMVPGYATDIAEQLNYWYNRFN